ncbi:unnamed protein product [Symbiodinium natans]|uniref:Uncharacterized protein n=1 Tax=Symbiodinium natans TaxID=878477 RepID=A0A812H6Q4_9DINO|nr:unnamed protein product [Symbiodinium natans]
MPGSCESFRCENLRQPFHHNFTSSFSVSMQEQARSSQQGPNLQVSRFRLSCAPRRTGNRKITLTPLTDPDAFTRGLGNSLPCRCFSFSRPFLGSFLCSCGAAVGCPKKESFERGWACHASHCWLELKLIFL